MMRRGPSGINSHGKVPYEWVSPVAPISVTTNDGDTMVGETRAGHDDEMSQSSVTQIELKSRGLTEEYLGSKRVTRILKCLWSLEEQTNVAGLPQQLRLT